MLFKAVTFTIMATKQTAHYRLIFCQELLFICALFCAPIPNRAVVQQVDYADRQIRSDSIDVFIRGGSAESFSTPDSTTPLSTQEILFAGTTKRLQEIYAEHGYILPTHEQFIAQAISDWQAIQLAAWDSSRKVPLPDTLQPLVVESEGIRFSIYGIIHDDDNSRDYAASIQATLRSPGPWYVEAALTDLTELDSLAEAVEINDHVGLSPSTRVTHGLGLRPLLELYTQDPEVEFLAGIRSPVTIQQENSVSTKLSWRYSGELPAYLLIEESFSRGFSPWLEITRERSALQALFVKGIAQKLGQRECKILCGGLHAAEIEYFLHYPQNASARIQAITQKQIELYLKDPKDYEWVILKGDIYYVALPDLAWKAVVLLLIVRFVRRVRKRIRERSEERNRAPMAPTS